MIRARFWNKSNCLFNATTSRGQPLVVHKRVWPQTFNSAPPHHHRIYKSHAFSSQSKPHHVPIVIVGGGPTGLLLSTLLSHYSVPHELHEARTYKEMTHKHAHPQAHFINLRSMEILRHCGMLEKTVEEAMPPANTWEHFHFCHSVLGGSSLGLVRHGIQRTSETSENDSWRNGVSPCRVGHLGQHQFTSILLEEALHSAKTFSGKTDYGEEQQMVKLGSRVMHVATHPDRPVWLVTSQQQKQRAQKQQQEASAEELTNTRSSTKTKNTTTTTTTCDILIAADGAHSTVLNSTTTNHPPTPPTIHGHLINIHFTTKPTLTQHLSSHPTPQAMLHFVFNEELIGVFVVHNVKEGNWVCQVPYFPPYQTLHVDFTKQACLDLVCAGLGLDPKDNQERELVEILSVRPWIMGTRVAPSFWFQPAAGNEGHDEKVAPVGAVVGDAAHVFPPAGGLGMNTGLQDAHALAWRLAVLHHHHFDNNTKKKNHFSSSNQDQNYHTNISQILQQYHVERQPVAHQNAALSERNYQRCLAVVRALGLDPAYPQLLVKTMEEAPFKFLSLDARAKVFRNLVKVATMPLASLKNDSSTGGIGKSGERRGVGNVVGDVLKGNVRRVLERGEGLPLLFPRYELGFTYPRSKHLNKDQTQTKNGRVWSSPECEEDGMHDDNGDDEEDDDGPYVPRLQTGHRLPHCVMQVLQNPLGSQESNEPGVCKAWPHLVPLDTPQEHHQHQDESPTSGDMYISLTDIAAQMRHQGEAPCFAVVRFSRLHARDPANHETDLSHSQSESWSRSMKAFIECMQGVQKNTRVSMRAVQVIPSNFRQQHVQGLVAEWEKMREFEKLPLVLRDVCGTFQALVLQYLQRAKTYKEASNLQDENFFVLVRPDGHVAEILVLPQDDVDEAGSVSPPKECYIAIKTSLSRAIVDCLGYDPVR